MQGWPISFLKCSQVYRLICCCDNESTSVHAVYQVMSDSAAPWTEACQAPLTTGLHVVYYLMGTEVSVWEDEKVLGMNGGDGGTLYVCVVCLCSLSRVQLSVTTWT